MSNPLANDAVVLSAMDRPRYLKIDKNGVPINKQVPKSYQAYTGTGGTIDYDGSNELNINGDALSSPLIIRLGTTVSKLRNWLGREVVINIRPGNLVNITLVASPALLCINGTSLLQGTHVVPADGAAKSIHIYFNSTAVINMDYGASSITTIAPKPPTFSFQRSTYVYGKLTAFVLPVVYIPDGSSYDVIFDDLNRDTEGYLFTGSQTLSVQGPGQQNLFGLYQPASQRTESTNIFGYLYQGSVYFGSFTIQMSPILSNVYDLPYFTGANSNGTLKMLNLDNAGVSSIAVDADGNTVQLGGSLIAIANNIADSIYFFVYSTSDTIIRYRSFISLPFVETLLDVSSLDNNFWTPGARISDIEYDEKSKCLYVLPAQNNAILLRIPIQPMDEVNRFYDVVNTGSFTGRVLNIAGGLIPQSIAVCPFTSALYVGHSRAAGNLSVVAYQDYNSLVQSFLYTHPTFNTQQVIVGFTALGQLVIHYETNLSVVTLNNARPLSVAAGNILAVFTLNSFSPSLSRTCYGWTQG